jgi:hypothetical protein
VPQRPSRVLTILADCMAHPEALFTRIRVGIEEQTHSSIPLLQFISHANWRELVAGEREADLPSPAVEVLRVRVPQTPGLVLSTIAPGQALTLEVRGTFNWIAVGGEQLE